jgi:hypothetical protein
MRCDYVFMYVGVTYYPNVNYTALGQLKVPSVDGPGAPKQGHLSYIDDPTKMVVQYVSGLRSPLPSVRFGTSPSQLTAVTVGTSATYKASDFCHDPANQTAQQVRQWFARTCVCVCVCVCARVRVRVWMCMCPVRLTR